MAPPRRYRPHNESWDRTGGHDLEAIRDAVNGWYVGVVALRQAGHSRFAALGAPQSFVPIIGHGRENKSTSLVCRFGRGRKLPRTEIVSAPASSAERVQVFFLEQTGPGNVEARGMRVGWWNLQPPAMSSESHRRLI